jgi:membrane protein
MNRALLRHLRREWEADRPTDVAAMMTYYAVFALFPMLVFVMTVGLLVVPPAWIRGALESASFTMPHEVSDLLTDQVVRMERAASASFAVGSALIALWGASRGTASLMSALNDMYEKEETRSWFRRQLIAIGTTLVVAALLIVAVVLIALGPLTEDRVMPPLDLVLDVARWLAAGLIVMVVWALLYSWLPDTDAPLRIFTPGAALGVLLWFGITQGFAFYLDRFASYEKTYGAVASVIVFLTWLWLSNLALLLGAEVNDVLAEIRKHDSAAAAELADGPVTAVTAKKPRSNIMPNENENEKRKQNQGQGGQTPGQGGQGGQGGMGRPDQANPGRQEQRNPGQDQGQGKQNRTDQEREETGGQGGTQRPGQDREDRGGRP